MVSSVVLVPAISSKLMSHLTDTPCMNRRYKGKTRSCRSGRVIAAVRTIKIVHIRILTQNSVWS